jgi:hypothetical protein
VGNHENPSKDGWSTGQKRTEIKVNLKTRYFVYRHCSVRRWEDNIKLDLREMGIDGANWIRLAHDRVQWWAFVNMVMKLRVP